MLGSQDSLDVIDVMRLAKTRPNPQGNSMISYPVVKANGSKEETFQDGWSANLTLPPQKLSSEGFIYKGNGDIPRCFFYGGGLHNWKPDDDTSSLTKCYVDHIRCVNCGRILHHWVPHYDSWEENNQKNAVPAEPISQTSSSLVNQPDQPTEKNQLQGQATPHLNQQGQQQGEELNMLTPAGQQVGSQQAATIWQQNIKKSEISTSSCFVITGILLTLFLMVPGCASAPANNCTGPDYIIQENGYCCGVVSCEENFTVLMCKVHYGNDTCAPCPEGSFLLDNTTSVTATSCVKPDCLKNRTRPSLRKSTTNDPYACPQWCQCDISFNYCGTDPCNCRRGTCPYRTVLQQDCGCKLITPSPPKPTLPKEIPVTQRNFTTSKPRINVTTESSALTVDNTPTPVSVTPFLPRTTKASDSQTKQSHDNVIWRAVGAVVAVVPLVILIALIIGYSKNRSVTRTTGPRTSPDLIASEQDKETGSLLTVKGDAEVGKKRGRLKQKGSARKQAGYKPPAKPSAEIALKRKKRFVKQEALENASTNTEVMGFAAKAKKSAHKDMDVDKVHDVMDEIEEQQDAANEVSEAISNPVGFREDVDEDDLSAELEDLEQEQLDEQLLDVGPISEGLEDLSSVPTAEPKATSSGGGTDENITAGQEQNDKGSDRNSTAEDPDEGDSSAGEKSICNIF